MRSPIVSKYLPKPSLCGRQHSALQIESWNGYFDRLASHRAGGLTRSAPTWTCWILQMRVPGQLSHNPCKKWIQTALLPSRGYKYFQGTKGRLTLLRDRHLRNKREPRSRDALVLRHRKTMRRCSWWLPTASKEWCRILSSQHEGNRTSARR